MQIKITKSIIIASINNLMYSEQIAELSKQYEVTLCKFNQNIIFVDELNGMEFSFESSNVLFTGKD